jgi:hypothetical protein
MEDIYTAELFDGEGTVTLATANGKFRYPLDQEFFHPSHSYETIT